MGYEVHITRADDWTESTRFPIPKNDWMALVASDPSLRVSDEDTVLWLGHPDDPSEKPQFWYEDGMITKKHPDQHTLHKMAEIANRLGAKVLDDDGAEYGEEEGTETPEMSGGVSKRPWWQKLFRA